MDVVVGYRGGMSSHRMQGVGSCLLVLIGCRAPDADPVATLAPAIAEPEAITGILVCDQYLSLYERCEPILEPEIMAGDRRPVHAEKGWLEHLAGTPEKAAMPEACQQMLTELRPKCPVPEPAAAI